MPLVKNVLIFSNLYNMHLIINLVFRLLAQTMVELAIGDFYKLYHDLFSLF